MILMNDFKAEPEEIREAMLAAAKRVLDSGWFVLGKEVENFEREWAAVCGTTYGVGVGNGMDAIEIALRAVDIGPGDEVITTSMTAFATVLAILRAGAVPVLADIEADTGLLSIESVRRCISARTKAVVLVHLYGQVRNMDAWTALCKERDIVLIEDCAQAHLASWGGRMAGAFGRAGAYSFYPTKNLGAPGDGGMLVTQDEALAKKSARLRNYGQSVRYHHPELGMNSRLDEIQAAMLGARLKWLREFTQRRREIADAYRVGIRQPLVTLLSAPQEPAAHAFHLFVVICEAREQLQKHLQSCGIQALIHYPIPVHQQSPCSELARDPEGLRHTERHANTCLSLPCHPQMSVDDVEAVIAAVNSFDGG
ncbi:dTDP-4-amino-4,6-dideoxygalactose transaminase [Herbaspirillum sp. Sphag1AN]|uniref:DegT/DnrJ/EryC1/StrS family aminotransferase n=1 Tax=unclassified Herbaspirillum TaxID=2624150 RepID=UPI001621B126|nr:MULTISPECIES: DegT/DnrJ/EryC1/StrS family aminotransferase [unclassified Herbaspirillum]MBB3212978.1 dTDP-4-amino-4,6-dideoxygalactose transaminase [Herbaspirillum sp. Sphag1AN]MBB3246175.1 dTDP-4-amino-4,6-dideoxygalactose transaminase [Herbaspirillum sp. Sphag64]